jgi:Ca2+-binding EF-hand superfamily protein
MTYAPTVLGAPTYGTVMPSPYGGFAYGGARRIVAQPRYTLGAYAQKGYEARHVTDEKLNNLKEVRAACGLQHIPVAAGLQIFKGIAEEGKLNKELFEKAYIDLLAAHGVSAPSADVTAAVYDLFDRDQNGIVDMMELVCAISLLCQGTEDDKIAAVFKAFDEDGDGYVSMAEMNTFLLSVFRVVLTPAVAGIMRAQGVEVDSAEDLAAVTTEECFKDADLNHDGRLSIDEFRKWFYEPSTDPSLVFSPIKNIFH